MIKSILLFSAIFATALSQPSDTCPQVVCPNGKNAQGSVAVVGTGSLMMTPDEASVAFTVELTRNNATRARADAAQITNSTMDAILKIGGITQNDITTTAISLNPKYNYVNDTNKLMGYQFSQTFNVNIKNLTADLLSNVIDTAVTAGGNYLQVSSVYTDLAKETKANAANEARKTAVSSALQTASALASAANVTLGPVISVTDQTSIPVPVPMPSSPGMPAAAAADKEPPKTPVSLGETEVQASVSVVSAICPP